MSERILIMVKNKVVIKERDAWSDLANFIGEMVAKYWAGSRHRRDCTLISAPLRPVVSTCVMPCGSCEASWATALPREICSCKIPAKCAVLIPL